MRSAFLVALALVTASCNAPAPPAAPPETAAAPSAAPPIEPAADVTPAAAPAAAPATGGTATAWTVDRAASSIHFSVNHKVYGAIGADFKSWTAKIVFDPADLAHSSANVTIQMAGVKLGLPDADAQWPLAEWANPAKFPTASFASSSFKALGGNKFQAIGTVTVKGKAVPATMPFTVTIAGNTATMTGTLTLDRTKLGIGMQSDATGDWVDKNVTVAVKVKAAKG